MGWRLCLFVMLSACGGTNADVAQGPASSTEPASVEESPPGDERPASDESPASDERPASDESPPETSVEPVASAPEPAAGGVAPPFDVSEEAARRICELEVDDMTRVQRCAFVVGHDLPDAARVDLLEVVYSDTAEVTAAILVFRSAEDMEYPNTFTAVEAEEEPGMEEEFTLGTLDVSGTRVSLPVETVSTEYPNTGDPDLPTGATEERERFVVQCDTTNGVYECERIEP